MNRKNIISLGVLLLLIVATAWVLFRGVDPVLVGQAIGNMSLWSIIISMALALFFVAAEGMMIWYLLHSVDGQAKLRACIRYSFIGFFFSGITPSATGGQPAQLYCMSRDGRKLSDSTVVLMAVATIYKFVLVLMGIGIIIFWRIPMRNYLGNYEYLYYLGLGLNIALVLILVIIMVNPAWMLKVIMGMEGLLVRWKILKASEERRVKIIGFVRGYEEAIQFFICNKIKIIAVIAFTILQRCSVFAITAVIYYGYYGQKENFLEVMLLQATIYIAVDMLPLPGSQGITELMYQNVFGQLFTGVALTASLCVTRSMNFYFPLVVSGCVVLLYYIRAKKIQPSHGCI